MKAIVVLGCMLHSCEPTDEMQGRVERSIQFARMIHPDLIVFSGGKTFPECQYSESGMMQKLAIEAGADKTMLVTEEKSTTTVENAIYVRELLEERKFSGDLYIVTSCYHMSRSITIFRKVIPGMLSLSGLCYECKTERLQSEATRLIIDESVMSKVEWDSSSWLRSYKNMTKIDLICSH
ncbi:protein containing DUF218 [mine drainage metagenome]|uniref:Protein containing DUF218 n=1 Tax=mine drainage metagenome TaxID=410659 RepID=T1CYP4_9ZZZZ